MKIWKEKEKSRQSLSSLKQKKNACFEKKMFRKVLKKLLSYYPKNIKGHALKRIKKMAAAICGLIRKKKPHMSALGSGLPQMITGHSQEKAMKTFLENSWTDFDFHYLPFISDLIAQILGSLDPLEKIILVLDGSKMGNKHMALMVSLVYKNRGIPLAWLVHKKPKGHFGVQVHLELVEKVRTLLQPLLSPTSQVGLLGDGEFDSIKLQQFCTLHEWEYVFRTACNSVFYEDQSRFKPKDLEASKEQGFLFIPNVEFTKERYGNVNLVYWHTKEYEEALPLISNLKEPIDIIELYKKRYSIESLFKDIKSNTFNLHKTRLKNEHAISNLIMVGAFALILLIKIALKNEHNPIRKFVNRVRKDRKVNSLITFGRDMLDYFLEEGLSFSFSFQFSKFSKNSS